MTRAIFQPPKLRQEECEEGERRATWLELFFDLIFVVAIAQLAHNFKEDFSFIGFAKLALRLSSLLTTTNPPRWRLIDLVKDFK
jgi:low temperature requirement protein LtrA